MNFQLLLYPSCSIWEFKEWGWVCGKGWGYRVRSPGSNLYENECLQFSKCAQWLSLYWLRCIWKILNVHVTWSDQMRGSHFQFCKYLFYFFWKDACFWILPPGTIFSKFRTTFGVSSNFLQHLKPPWPFLSLKYSQPFPPATTPSPGIAWNCFAYSYSHLFWDIKLLDSNWFSAVQ